jgi:HK97 family phage prohead protease
MTTAATPTKARAPFEVKGLDVEARTFEGLASTWDRDMGDDVIHRGAFKDWLGEWEKGGKVLPLVDQHNYGSVRSVIGKLMEARETKDGLLTKWQVIEGADGDEILTRLKGGYIDALSIGYEPVEFDFTKDDTARFGEIRHIRKLSLMETSLVLWPMNPNARIDLDSVKSACGTMEADELRKLTGYIGGLLRTAPAKAADPPPEPPATPPEAPPDDVAAQKAEEDAYPWAEALAHRIRAVTLRSSVTLGRNT